MSKLSVTFPDDVNPPSPTHPSSSKSMKKKTFHLPLGSPSTPQSSVLSHPSVPSSDDPERQPLIATSTQRRMSYPIIGAVMGIIAVGLLIGFGGWRLGKGEGGGRWPGGPQ